MKNKVTMFVIDPLNHSDVFKCLVGPNNDGGQRETDHPDDRQCLTLSPGKTFKLLILSKLTLVSVSFINGSFDSALQLIF